MAPPPIAKLAEAKGSRPLSEHYRNRHIRSATAMKAAHPLCVPYIVRLYRNGAGWFATDQPIAPELVCVSLEASTQPQAQLLLERARNLARAYNDYLAHKALRAASKVRTP